jgi:23S rRNA (uracil1939-C5)-methyltransferase
LILDSSRGKVFNLTECHLVNSWFAEGVQAVRKWWKENELEAYHPYRNTGSLRTLTMREGQRTGDRMVFLTVSGNPEYALRKHHIESFVAYLRDAIEPLDSELSIFLRIQQTAKGMTTNFYEMHLHGPDHIRETLHVSGKPLTFKISPVAFFQPNTRQAEQLYSTALHLSGIPDNGIVFDLYCGTGTLGICAAQKAKQVIGIELSPEACLDAVANAKANGIDNIDIRCGSVSEVLQTIKLHPDLVMVDPPRAGLDSKAIRLLIDLKPKMILYVSCNPVTQAENVAAFLEAGYQLKVIQPVDQFPHTTHVENIVILS